MKKLISLSILLISFLGMPAYANVLKIGSGDDFSIAINGGLPATLNITETAGYYGFNEGQPQNFDNPTSLHGNSSDLVAVSGDVADLKKQGVSSVQIGLTQMTTDKYGKLNTVNCKIDAPVQPTNINLYVNYDPSTNTYICK